MRYPATTDGRHFVVCGRLWRTSNPALLEYERARLTRDLMAARREVGRALRAGDGEAERDARSRVDAAKVALGERGPTVRPTSTTGWRAQRPTPRGTPPCRRTRKGDFYALHTTIFFTAYLALTPLTNQALCPLALLALLIAGCNTSTQPASASKTLTLVAANGLSTSFAFEAPDREAEQAFVREVSRFTREFARNSDLTARFYTSNPRSSLPEWVVDGLRNERLSCFGFAFQRYARDFAPFAKVRIMSAMPSAEVATFSGTRVPAALASTMMDKGCTMTYGCGICRTVDPSQRGCIATLKCNGQSDVCSTANEMMCAEHNVTCSQEEVGS